MVTSDELISPLQSESPRWGHRGLLEEAPQGGEELSGELTHGGMVMALASVGFFNISQAEPKLI